MFLGLSAAGILTKAMVKEMAENPIIFALANPDPEILPEHAHEVRPDVIMATGRSDYPNQVNNALCFPYIFRGALDVGATTINEEMKIVLQFFIIFFTYYLIVFLLILLMHFPVSSHCLSIIAA